MVRPLSRLNLALNRGDGAASPAAFGTPPDGFSNLDIWWDPNDGSTVTTIGSDIQGITNKGSGGSATLVGPAISTPAVNPATLKTEDGVDWIEFIAANTQVIRLDVSSTVFRRGTSNFTMGAVFRSTMSTGFNTLLMHGITGSTAPGFELDVPHVVASGTNRGLIRDTVNVTASASHVDTNLFDGETHTLFMTRFNSGGLFGELYLYLDGVLEDTAAMPSAMGSLDNLTGGSWTDLMIGARPASGVTTYQNFSDQLVGDVLIYGQALSNADITNLHTYLMWKWQAP